MTSLLLRLEFVSNLCIYFMFLMCLRLGNPRQLLLCNLSTIMSRDCHVSDNRRAHRPTKEIGVLLLPDRRLPQTLFLNPPTLWPKLPRWVHPCLHGKHDVQDVAQPPLRRTALLNHPTQTRDPDKRTLHSVKLPHPTTAMVAISDLSKKTPTTPAA